ncbi:MAG: DUF1566 domain-containing protein [Gammaproteobacteria bacterium]|nr:DUF1566 domain-containing protein [Gammaproteobacteria bacterium]
MKSVSFCFLIVLSFILAGCEDSGERQPMANIASVNAGSDLSVLEGQNFTLTAAVYPEGGSITWTQISGPFIEDFPIEDELSTEVTAPPVAVDTQLVFQARYISLDGQLVTDDIIVMVENINQAPVAIIQMDDNVVPPFATYEVVNLSGESSYDDGEIREYLWQQVDDNTPLIVIGSRNTQTLQFQAPFVSSITNFKVQLTVTDNFGLSSSNIIDVPVDSAKSAIAANAGLDQNVEEFTQVTLDGRQSVSSISDVNCRWSLLTGTAVQFNDDAASDDGLTSTNCLAKFIAPDVDAIESLVFELTVTDSANNQASDETLVVVNPRNLGILHDTGVTECYDNIAVIDCGNANFPMQDADTGRDEISDLLDKSGAGPRSFDFTKFDVNGDELPNDSLVYSCVRDNFTGFIWEVKQPSTTPRFTTLRSVDNYYTMDDSGPPLETCPSEEDCTVQEYIEFVNEQTYCGGANWRIPTYMELLNLLDYYDIDQESLLPSEFFPYTPDEAELGHKFYWVSDTSAEGGGDGFNWVIDLATGDDSVIAESQFAYVILIRTP